MVDTPEKIWASSVTENYGEWRTTTSGMPRPTEYTRSDLVAELAAENERLRQAASDADIVAKHFQSERDHLQECLEDVLEQMAISRTGAVKVKPLEWSRHPAGGEQALAAGLGMYRVHENGDDWYLVPDHMGAGGKAAAQADYERRIISALVPSHQVKHNP